MRRTIDIEGLKDLMKEVARSAPGQGHYRVFFVGGGTAVHSGWRESTIDVDLYSDTDDVFSDVQAMKERLQMNIEFARPEDFVPALSDTENRHVFIETIGSVSFYHYDPYAQLLSKVVRGFRRDILDANNFLRSGMVDAEQFRALVNEIPRTTFARYPSLSPGAVRQVVADFLSQAGN